MKQKEPFGHKDSQFEKQLTLDDVDIYDFLPPKSAASQKAPTAPLPLSEEPEFFEPADGLTEADEDTAFSDDPIVRADIPAIVFQADDTFKEPEENSAEEPLPKAITISFSAEKEDERYLPVGSEEPEEILPVREPILSVLRQTVSKTVAAKPKTEAVKTAVPAKQVKAAAETSSAKEERVAAAPVVRKVAAPSRVAANRLDAEHIFRSSEQASPVRSAAPKAAAKPEAPKAEIKPAVPKTEAKPIKKDSEEETVIFTPVSSAEKTAAPEAPAKKNAFLESLDNLKPDDLAPAPPKKRSKNSASAILSKVLIGVCGAVFVISAAVLIRHMVEYKIGDDLYGEVSEKIFEKDLAGDHELAPSKNSMSLKAFLDYDSLLAHEKDQPLPYDDPGQTTYNPKFEQMKANLTYLKRQNPDIFGYIYIPDTKISYPIVKGSDNDFYLTHSYTGSDLIAGAIFADCRSSDKVEDNRNLVLYGHNMQNGSMFNNVQLFQNEYVFRGTNIELYSFDGIYIYEPFAIYDTVATENYFRVYFDGDEDFVKFCDRRQNKSFFKKDITFSPNDRILTLSSCTNAGDGRWVLHARLIRIER